MNRLVATILMLAFACSSTPALADEAQEFVFKISGLHVTNLNSTINKVSINCRLWAMPSVEIADAASNLTDGVDGFIVASGSREFSPAPLENQVEGIGVNSGPFEIRGDLIHHANLVPKINYWTCGLRLSTASETYYFDNESRNLVCDDEASEAPLCPRTGQSPNAFFKGKVKFIPVREKHRKPR